MEERLCNRQLALNALKVVWADYHAEMNYGKERPVPNQPYWQVYALSFLLTLGFFVGSWWMAKEVPVAKLLNETLSHTIAVTSDPMRLREWDKVINQTASGWLHALSSRSNPERNTSSK